MKKGYALIMCIILTTSIFFIPIPSVALDFNLDSSLSNANASFWGENANDYAGYRVAIAGDVNGDGYDDILIGAWLNDENGANAGQAYLIFGKASGWSMDADLSNADASFWGEHAGDIAGLRVAGAGDVNGDGYDDILISATSNGEGATNAGQTYLILGKASGWAKDTNLSNSNASFWGEHNGDTSGYSIAGAGDVNDDGYDDFLIGAVNNDDGGSNAGQTYLILGKRSGWAMDTNLSKADASFWGENAGDISGIWVDGAGDVNGDGYDDFLISAYYNNDGGTIAGQTYLILGKPSGWTRDTDLSKADASFWGENAGDNSGVSVAGTGDVNGDGYDDFLIGAYKSGDGGSDAGQTYLILGKASGWAMDTDLSKADASFLGEYAGDYSGRSVDGAGDVNGDGYDEILIGAALNSDGGTRAGQTYLILGKPSGWAMDTNLSKADASFWGEVNNDDSGDSVAGAGDVNGDGYDDILIGAWANDDGGSIAGQTYLVFPDSNSKPSSIDSVKAYSDDSFSHETLIASVNDTVFIELKGTDGDSNTNDTALVNVKSSASDRTGFTLRLRETGKNTGTYRGNITIMNRTRDSKGWINASNDETVNVSSLQYPTKYATISIGTRTQMWPLTDNPYALEDTAYNVHYWSNRLSAQWKFKTNASWLTLNATTHNISGTPDNGDVGTYYVTINVSEALWGSVEHNFTLKVNNTRPDITSNNILQAVQDQPYIVNYNSSDDGQGTITYHLQTDTGPWLVLDTGTGVLSGTPGNGDVGQYHVNVSVDDGNGGRDWSNFILTVKNVNDAPVIISDDQLFASEDSLYCGLYYATDIDKGDSLNWYLSTNASSWLKMDQAHGVLSGIPTNDDVGKHWVNVTVKDLAGAFDYHNFILTVNNTNDVPVITSAPITKASAFYMYVYDVNATDVDVGDVLKYSLDIKPENMTIVPTTGLIQWTPSKQQKGPNHVLVNVTDGHSSVKQDFNITVVLPPPIPPQVMLSLPPDGSEVMTTTRVLSWTWKDPDSDTVYFDVYLSKAYIDVETKAVSARVAHAITATNMTTGQLEKGMVYYWTVIPNDGVNLGNCTSGIWSFKAVDTTVHNNPPVIVSMPLRTAEVGKQYQYQVVASDADGDKLTYNLTTRPDGMIIDADVGLIVWIPTDAQVGNQSVAIWVSDGKIKVTQGFNVMVKKKSQPVNSRPVITQMPDTTVKIGDVFNYQVAATDADTSDVLTYKLEGQPIGMTISSDGIISWTPSEDQVGEHTITVNVTDGKDHATAQIKVTVLKKEVPPTHKGSDAMMLGIIAAVVIAVILILVAVIAMRRREAPEVAKVEPKAEESKVSPKVVPSPIKKEPKTEEPQKKKVEPETTAKVKEEIDLDELEDKD